VFQRSGLPFLRHYNTHTDPYFEDYSLGKERLLANAIEQITRTVGGSSLLFVEDTSLRIEALSTSDADFPGLAVKEWFAQATFEQTNIDVREKGDDRRVVVKSDIGLHVPGLQHPIYFHGETRGTLSRIVPSFGGSTQYPWLTPNTFNGWFIPDGGNRCLGEMSLEESWPFDFRIKSLLALIDRLEEYTAALNLPANAFSRRKRSTPLAQLSLMPHSRPVLIVIGKTCSGKTTLGERAQQNAGFRWFEASDIVRAFRDRDTVSPDEPIGDFAKRLLADKGQDVVARKILQLVEGEPNMPVVITGFRTLEELELVKSELPQSSVVLIEASERTRFERYLARARPGSTSRISEFKSLDEGQWGFGLLRVAEDFADLKILNEGSLSDYHQQLDSVISGQIDGSVPGTTANPYSTRLLESSQLLRCLEVLSESGRSLDCNEISQGTARGGKVIRFNNVNKIVKRYPEFAQRIEISGEKVLYKITDAGRTYLRMKPTVVNKRRPSER
jgi:dephospho-CoA kinase/inosine/xanthosine triphosphate pyrophosphatase family protein